jgi:hypothetical protein
MAKVFSALDRITTIEDVREFESALYELEQTSADYRLNAFWDDLRAFRSEVKACAAEHVVATARRLIGECFPYIVAWHEECRGREVDGVPELAQDHR